MEHAKCFEAGYMHRQTVGMVFMHCSVCCVPLSHGKVLLQEQFNDGRERERRE